ncbi:MAG: 3-methyl-2-oxobutanoate hydroxymethyltransferase [Gammaproteobacteria bacterium]|nr:3-methyl-2-oxobutanoate hydroxymethyltransferase [Gammaproteobacteria bacterium]
MSTKITLNTLRQRKMDGKKFTCLTCYDASFAALLDDVGVDVLLVGDSLGMVIQGHQSTVPVSVDDMVYHTRMVARARKNALIMADMPFLSYRDPATAIANAGRLMAEGGAHMIKLEGGWVMLETVEKLAAQGIPVCAHLGLLPQSVNKLGGYRVQGREPDAGEAILSDALAMERAGADIVLMECVPTALAQRITDSLKIPTIGIGAGPHCDAQVLVLYDMLGITPGKRPKFSQDFLLGQSGVAGAVRAYVDAVMNGRFPETQHSYT